MRFTPACWNALSRREFGRISTQDTRPSLSARAHTRSAPLPNVSRLRPRPSAWGATAMPPVPVLAPRRAAASRCRRGAARPAGSAASPAARSSSRINRGQREDRYGSRVSDHAAVWAAQLLALRGGRVAPVHAPQIGGAAQPWIARRRADLLDLGKPTILALLPAHSPTGKKLVDEMAPTTS